MTRGVLIGWLALCAAIPAALYVRHTAPPLAKGECCRVVGGVEAPFAYDLIIVDAP
jgi:hypothetical protein